MPRSAELAAMMPLAGLAIAFAACGRSSTDLEGETRHLRQRSAQIVAAEASRDIDSVLTFYADDAVIHPPGAPPAKGHQAIRRLYQDFYRTVPFTTFKASTSTVEICRGGDLAYETGVNRFEFNRGGARTEELGKYLTVWRKRGGKWQVVAVAFSGDHAS